MKNTLLTLFFVSCLATGGIFVKLSSLPPISTGFYRILLSLPLLYLFAKWETKNVASVSQKDKGILLLAGAFLAADLILWNISFHYTTVANANLLANLVPFTIIPVSYFVYQEKISFRFFISLIITLFGLAILIGGKTSITSDNLFGDFLAASTSLFYAAFLLTVYRLRKRIATTLIMYYSAYGSLLVLGLFAFILEGWHIPTNWQSIWPLLGLALFSQILGQGGLSYVLGKISAIMASLLVLTQPVISAMMAYFLFHESLTYLEWFGMMVVLVGIFIAKQKNES